MISYWSRLRALAAAVLIFGGLAACDDNPVDHDDDHADAAVAAIRIGGVTVYAYDVTDGSVRCEIDACGVALAVGGAPQTATVHFLDESGRDVTLELSGDEYGLRVEAADSDLVAVLDSEAGKFAFGLRGTEIGVTELRVWLMHGDHEDLSTPPFGSPGAIAVTVTA